MLFALPHLHQNLANDNVLYTTEAHPNWRYCTEPTEKLLEENSTLPHRPEINL